MAFDSPLNVIIVGAGIAGLAAARALRERHNVTIIDQSRLKNEVGAAIHIGPNASGILLKLGLSTELVGSVVCNHVIERTYENITQIDLKFDAEEQWGSPWLLNHRADLHRELYRLATDSELSGPHPEKFLGCAVERCDPVAGNVRLANGRVISGDVIIGADGIHSVVRESIIGKYLPGVRSGHSAYRFLIDSSKLREDSELAFLVEDGAITSFVAQTRRIVCYPCRNLELLNVVAMLPDTALFEESVVSWNVEGSVEEMLKSFAEFDPTIKRIFSYATDCTLWQLRDQDPLDTWTKGKAIIIGDAAHAMLPHQGQGGSQAIEDADAIAVALENATPEDVPKQLAKVQKLRLDRTAFIQKCSREIAHGPGVDENGNQQKLNANKFAQFLYGYPGARTELQKLDAHEIEENGML